MKASLIKMVVLLAAIYNVGMAQEKPVQISLNSIRTDLKQSAMKMGIQYIQSLDTLWEKEHFKDWDKSLLTFTPEFGIETGTNDAFSAISGKITGFFMFFDTVRVAGQITPRTDKIFHTMPVSAGFETSNAFQSINGIVEIGYVPWYQMPTSKTPQFLRHTTFGLYAQGGYKFFTDSTQRQSNLGGNVDKSAEKINEFIFRVKSHFSIDTKQLLVNSTNNRGIALIGTADTWYDLMNSKIYYRIEGKLKVLLTKNYFFDFVYEKGSGAPNFNQGDQFGMGLTVSF